MNTDFRITTDALDHPKLVKLKRMTGDAGIISLMRLWGFTARYHPRGDLNDMTPDDIEISAKWEGPAGEFFNAILNLKLLDECLGQYSVHDWEEHNSYAYHAPERTAKAKNAARIRWASQEDASSNAAGNADGNAPSPNPNPVPDPSPPPNPSPKKTRTKPKTKQPSDNKTRQITDCYQELYIKRFNKKPIWGAVEGKRIKRLLTDFDGDADRICTAFENAFKSKEKFMSDNVGSFMTLTAKAVITKADTITGVKGPRMGGRPYSE